MAFSIVEASIADMLEALSSGRVTAVRLLEKTLDRIDEIDSGPGGLNAVVVPNPDALEAARVSDGRWATGTARALEGIPFTVKDSFMVRGLTVAAGSPAFVGLKAQWNAFTVEQALAAGAVLVGKTNMPPMADGGMQRGAYGRAESPYNRNYLAAAYASGSSNGSGVAVATSIGAFGLGEETVSSGRSPASNNSLCAYTPSWGILSIRGNWPLFPARDVVVPHTRTMPDMLALLNVLVADDDKTRGDFWRNQSVAPVPSPSDQRPDDYLDLANFSKPIEGVDYPEYTQEKPLAGMCLAVPRMYLGLDPEFDVTTRQSVIDLFEAAKKRLESLGAKVVESDFRLIEEYEGDRPGGENVDRLGVLPDGWMDTEFNHILAFGWDDFLRANNDPNISSLADVDPDKIFPAHPDQLPDRYEEVADYENRYRETVRLAKEGISDPRWRKDFEAGIKGILQLRKNLFDDWLDQNGFDGVIFAANGDVGAANSDVDVEAANHAWSNGVFFSNGNYALRHLGLPTITVPMGIMADTQMPVGLTFVGKAYSDNQLLRWATIFESPGSLRQAPKFLG